MKSIKNLTSKINGEVPMEIQESHLGGQNEKRCTLPFSSFEKQGKILSIKKMLW